MTPITPPPGLLDKLAEALISEGGGPGDSLHSWRCEYPDIYGPCDCVAETVRELWDAVAEGLGLRGRHITDHGIGYFDEDGNAILQYGGTLHQCEDVLARHPNWFHPDAKILVKQWMFLQSSPEGEWRTVGEPQP